MTPAGTPWTTDVSPLDVKAIARAFVRHNVDFVFVGGIAAMAHGYSRFTEDADIVPDLSATNIQRLASALRAMNARVFAEPGRTDLADGAPPEAEDLDFSEPETLRSHLIWQFNTDAGRLDVLLVIDAAGGYREISRTAQRTTMGDVQVLVISLDDLIESKETAGRSKDLAALDELRQLRDRRVAGSG